MRPGCLLVLVGCLLAATPAAAQSVITARLDDPAAVYLTPDAFGVKGDGIADDTAGLQAALDKASGAGGGIVFVPSGRYRITRTLYLWRAVRVIGYGATRPVLTLGPNTPGYQQGIGLMVMASGGGPAVAGRGRGPVPFPPPGQVPANPNIVDADHATFYPGFINVDFEIGDGNPAAVAIRFHAAQHAVLRHMRFSIGSGLAALTQIANEAQDLRFEGGRYAILTDNTAPFWPFTVLDSTFQGQREAAIRTHMATLTLIRSTFRDVPVAVAVDDEYSEQIWIQDSRFERVSTAALLISNERNPATQVGVQGVVCADVPVFARWRESGKTQAAPAATYRVRQFTFGLSVPAGGGTGRFETRFDATPLATLPAPPTPAIRPLPASTEWVNVRTLGVKGDGQADDTVALKQAVASNRPLFLPIGHYIVTDTIVLGPNTQLIALHPGLVQLDLPDNTPGYQGLGGPKAILQSPQGGDNIVSGIGIYSGNVNQRATGLLWMAGENSLVDDVQFHGGAGSYLSAAVRTAFYSGGRGGGPGPGAAGAAPAPAPAFAPAVQARSGSQYPSLWVTRGGGGTFTGVWSPDEHAQGAMYVSDTSTPGHVYELSAEHHLFNEVKIERVQNWEFIAPQTEEEASSSQESVAFEIVDSKNITIANFKSYRVTRSVAPHPAGVRVYGSSDIRFRNMRTNSEHGYSTSDENGPGTFLRVGKFAYSHSIHDVTRGVQIRDREFAVFDVVATTPAAKAAAMPSVVAAGASVEKLAEGFFAISGGAVDATGVLYFVDKHQQRIYKWSAAGGLSVVRHDTLDPVNLAVDRSGSLLVVSSAGAQSTVYSFKPGTSAEEITLLQPQAPSARPEASVVLPVNVWTDGQFANQLNFETMRYRTLAEMFAREVTTPQARSYVSPDGSLVLPAMRVLRQGADGAYAGMDPSGWRWSHLLDTYGFVTARPGQKVHLVSSAENRTYSATVNADGTAGGLKIFADRGSEGVAADAAGNVYVLNGQVFVYNAAGTPLGQIDIPARPVQVLFGGPDRRTLFVLTHHALYSVKVR